MYERLIKLFKEYLTAEVLIPHQEKKKVKMIN